MMYKNLEIDNLENGIEINGIKSFSLKDTFECGQCFRWNKEEHNLSYTGVAFNRVINIEILKNKLIINNSNTDDFINIWYDYFHLWEDYETIEKKLSKKDKIMRKAIKYSSGLRLLRQDLFELLISYILSSNNRIPMIKKTVENISKKYGEKLEFNGKEYYTFPTFEVMSNLSEKEIKDCGGGFRYKYIYNSIKLIKEGKVNLNKINNSMSIKEIREILMSLPGVGPKVSDCIILFSGLKYKVFPTDVWIKRVMEELYFKKETKLNEIQEFAINYFDDLAGFAQEYLFNYVRNLKK